MRILKQAGVIAWFVGIAVFIVAIAWSGIGAVALAVASVGWGALLVVMTRVATVSIAGAGWWMLFPASAHLRIGTAIHVRIVREATNALLPLAQIGGDFIGARLLTLRGIPGPLAAASVIVDVLLQAATQFLFAVVGLATLVMLGANTEIAVIAATGLAIAAPLLAGFYLAQSRSGHRILQLILGFLTGDVKWRVLGTVDAVYQSLTMLYASRSRLVASSIVHMAGWMVGIAEVMVVLAFLGHPVGFAEAVVIESLMHAIRGAAFVIPGALGAQEAGLILLCAVFGIPPDEAVALSLVKRVADLALGLPGLVSWQVMEAQRLKTNFGRREG